MLADDVVEKRDVQVGNGKGWLMVEDRKLFRTVLSKWGDPKVTNRASEQLIL